MSEATQAAPQATPESAAPATAEANAATTAVSTTAPVAAQANAAPTTASETQQAPAAEQKFELKVPDGSSFDQTAIDRAISFAKEKGLSPEVAQAVLEREHLAITAANAAADAAWKEQQQQWTKTAQSDKELGGPAFIQNVELAHRVIKKFASEDFVKALEASGFGNHPELLRTFNRIGKMMGDDSLVLPGAQAGGKKSMEELFYGPQS